jgi:cation diffusion facilitator family transporter
VTTPPHCTTAHPAILSLRVVAFSIVVNTLLTLTKGFSGYYGNSFALIADAIESLSDVLSSSVVFVGLYIASIPADGSHPQGHGKAEPLSSLFVGCLLLYAAFVIVEESISLIVYAHQPPEAWTLLVPIIVVLVKELLFRYGKRGSTTHASYALLADAYHNRSDAITSAVAFIGISIALLGGYIYPHPRWASADDWAALIGTTWIVKTAFGIIAQSFRELTDAHPSSELESQIRRVALAVPGVLDLHKGFLRKSGFDYFVDLEIQVDGALTVSEGHTLAHEVQSALRRELSPYRFGRIVIHVEPFDLEKQKTGVEDIL